jgi:hypothetical protein
MGGVCSSDGGRGRHVKGFVGKPERQRPLEHPGINGSIILRWIFMKWDMGVWNGLNWLSLETGGGDL